MTRVSHTSKLKKKETKVGGGGTIPDRPLVFLDQNIRSSNVLTSFTVPEV